MSTHFCKGFLISPDGQKQEVSIKTQNGSMTINLLPSQTQIVYLPIGSMDTILNWYRIVDQAQNIGTLDLDNPETHINATFEVPLNELVKLEDSVRGFQVFLRRPNMILIGQIAPQIALVYDQQRNQKLIEKIAFFITNDPMAVSRLDQLRQEADILIQMQLKPHKNIIKLQEISTNLLSVSLLLEICEGGDLLKLLNSKKFLDIRGIMLNLMHGIQHLHKHDILHRDIKLQNVLLLNDQDPNTLKIADFGLACHKTQLKFYNPRCGTPGYTAPEVFDQTTIYDEKVDIYSAGVIFYNLLTSRNPFGNSKNPQEILTKNIQGNYETIHLDNVQDKVAVQLVKLMLSKDPKTRPSATQVLQHKYLNFVEEETKSEYIFENLQQCTIGNVKVSQLKSKQMPQTNK